MRIRVRSANNQYLQLIQQAKSFLHRAFSKSVLPTTVLFILIIITWLLLLFPTLPERAVQFFTAMITPSEPQNTPIRIAYAGALKKEADKWGGAIYRGTEMLIDKINAAGGINGRLVELMPFNDENDPDIAGAVAQSIADRPEILAVIGHQTSQSTRVAADVYRQTGIAAITPTATDSSITFENDWYFRTIFDQDRQANSLAYYIKVVLQHNASSIVYVDDAYGATIANVFAATAAGAGLDILHRIALPPEPSEAMLNQTAATLANEGRSEAILLVLWPELARPLVERLRAAGVEASLIGTDAPASFFTADQDTISPSEKEAARYTDGMYLVVPFMSDTANAAARRFFHEFRQRYGVEALWSSIYGYDTALLLVQALQNTDLTALNSDLTEAQSADLRLAVRDQLQALDSPAHGVAGLSGLLFFDSDGDAIQPIPVAKARDGHLSAASKQLQIIEPGKHASTLRRGGRNILDMHGTLLQIAQVIYTGIQINRLYDIDEDSQTFKTEFDIWFRFSGDLDPQKIIFPDATTPVRLDDLRDSSTVSPERYQAYRVEATFTYAASSANLIDREQEFVIRFHHENRDAGRLVFIPDRLGMGLTDANISWSDKLRDEQILSSGSGWVIKQASVSQESISRSALGNPLYPVANLRHSSFHAAVQAHKGEVSLKRQIQTVLPPSTSLATFIAFTLLLFLTWLKLVSAKYPLTIILLRLTLTTILFYLFEAIFLDRIGQYLEIYQLQPTLLIFNSLWWIVPAVWINALLSHLLWERSRHPVPQIAQTFAKLGVYSIAGLCIMAFVFEQPLTTIWAASGVITLILGFALQNPILDAFSGLMLNLERPFQQKSWIQVTNEEYDAQGRVEQINWRTTSIITEDGDLVVIPNSVLSEAALTNFSAPEETTSLAVLIPIDFRVPVKRARRILEAGARSAVGAGVSEQPPPRVLLDEPGENAFQYRVQVHYNPSMISAQDIKNAILENILAHLTQAGISFAAPLGEGALMDWQIMDDRLQLLAQVDLFNGFDQQALALLAQQIELHLYPSGMAIITQGAEDAYSMYGLAEGLLSAHVNVNGKEIKVGEIQPGICFGEKSLLADEPRSATVRTITDSLVYEIRRETIEALLTRRPELADRLSRVIAEREVNNDQTIQQSEHERRMAADEKASDLLYKMKKIFYKVLGDA